ncbi:MULTISPECIES: hypothetical protein [Vitreoscilla]|uniref:Uncharacterized protein n=1 Tax=Vitreoscilla stercoraria TaxID=61 RepID=A0ABY4EAD8_VITST|nr:MULTISPECIES: hypothetical protein [Vitreoscilla]AUZ05906.1 hypothetical protein ADP71_26080 [Vitreoscilla sp. C1]UOO92724.1 hypothetical protein LVJ81_01360 [Vitreoscilla stercoraria]
MTPDEEKELLELEAQIIRLRMLNNQYARHLRKKTSHSLLGNVSVVRQLGEVNPETWRAFITPNTVHNKILMLVITALLAFFKKKRS